MSYEISIHRSLAIDSRLAHSSKDSLVQIFIQIFRFIIIFKIYIIENV